MSNMGLQTRSDEQLFPFPVISPRDTVGPHGGNSTGLLAMHVVPSEVETQLEIARNLGYLSKAAAADLLEKASEVGRIINGLRTWTKTSLGDG